MYNIGIVLSGGGARGIAHLGVLHGLDKTGIKPNIISGTSSGAIIGALYANGYSPKQILKMAKDQASLSLARLVLTGGLFSEKGLRIVLKTAIPHDDFDQLNIPLVVTATDIIKGEVVEVLRGPLHDVIVGSAAVPVLFSPVKYGRQYLVDGGVMNNFPIECIRHQCNKIIGVHVNKINNDPHKEFSRLHVLERCFRIAIANTVKAKASLCDLFIEPLLTDHSMFEMKHLDALFRAGYNAVLEKEKTLRSWIEND